MTFAGNNDLELLDFEISIPFSKLEILDLSGNRLSFIDLAELPRLKALRLDRNSVASIESLSLARGLETLLWREQALVPAYGFSELQYQHCNEVRHLYLSGNSISAFTPLMPFLNLQHLELASTGLQTLSADLGSKCPNLRTINLNYNALRDLRPLLGIMKLRSLSVVGNRVARLRRTAAVIDRLGKELLDIDLRNNPLTVGFYSPQATSREGKQIVPHTSRVVQNEEDDRASSGHSYILPPPDNTVDASFRERLDEDTKLRRRVYEMLILNGVKSLLRLDGLEVDRKHVGCRDGVWERLLELGVLKEKQAL